MKDTDGRLKREWEAAEAEWGAARSPAERAAVERKFLALERRWRQLQERKVIELTDDARMRGIRSVVDEWARVTGVPVQLVDAAKWERGQSAGSDVPLFWALSMSYAGDRATFDEPKWDTLVDRINEELRRLAPYIAWDRSGPQWAEDWARMPDAMYDGDEPVTDEYRLKKFTWVFEPYEWHRLPDRPR